MPCLAYATIFLYNSAGGSAFFCFHGWPGSVKLFIRMSLAQGKISCRFFVIVQPRFCLIEDQKLIILQFEMFLGVRDRDVLKLGLIHGREH